MTKLQAMNNYVMIEVDQAEDKQAVSQHDLVIPAGAQRYKTTGMVVSAGPTCRIPGLGPGVRLLISPYGIGYRVMYQRKEYRVALDHQFLGYFADEVDESQLPG